MAKATKRTREQDRARRFVAWVKAQLGSDPEAVSIVANLMAYLATHPRSTRNSV